MEGVLQMIHYVNGDLVEDGRYTVFCHQTNCFGTMGAGIAKQIARKYPEVKDMDRRLFRLLGADELFGTIRIVKCNDGRCCVNMYAQYGYGRGVNTAYTDYAKLQACLNSLEEFLSNLPDETPVAFPYKIGCGLAGGDWTIVSEMLEKFAERVHQPVYVVKLPERVGAAAYVKRKGGAYARQ